MSVGAFVAGYRWSGSGAVSDWLADHDHFVQPRGSEAAYGEIRAINYGVRNLVRTASGDALYGERFGRHALCPDRSLKRYLLGRPLSIERGMIAPLLLALDAAYMTVAQTRVQPHPRYYDTLLNTQLGQDFRGDAEYRGRVGEFISTLRAEMVHPSSDAPVWERSPVQRAATRLLTLFADRIAPAGRSLIFDNAFSGLFPELFHLIDPEEYPVRIILFVRRDPRDQFAELLQYSRGTFPFMVGQFIRRYREQQERTRRFIEEYPQNDDTIVRLIDFESFVYDFEGTRASLQREIRELLDVHGITGDWKPEKFRPEESKKNTGVWHRTRHPREIRRVQEALPEYIHPLATSATG